MRCLSVRNDSPGVHDDPKIPMKVLVDGDKDQFLLKNIDLLCLVHHDSTALDPPAAKVV
jgi:hypothetical protein